ncbi:hypothetical protein GJ496_005166 [Pomphorhynchus laevis]|nr:hypothetical protein GJ496_005166 [Pomphorhynchus laevis]
MDNLTKDLPGVSVFMDDILVSDVSERDHVENLKWLLERLSDNSLRCNYNKCQFAMSSVNYLGHRISLGGVSKGDSVDSVKMMPEPHDVSTLSNENDGHSERIAIIHGDIHRQQDIRKLSLADPTISTVLLCLQNGKWSCKIGGNVQLLDLRPGSSTKWIFGIVTKVLGPRTVLIRSRGKLLKRHVDQLRKLNGTPLPIHNEFDTDDDYTPIIDTNSKFIDKNCENSNQETSKDLQFPKNTTIPENTRMSEANKQLLQHQSTIRRSQYTRRKPRLNSKNSLILPQWIKNDRAFLLKDDQALKFRNSFRKVVLLQSNGHYAVVRDEYGKESAVSVRKLARIPQTSTVACDDTVISQESEYASNSPSSYRDYETSRVAQSDNHVSHEEPEHNSIKQRMELEDNKLLDGSNVFPKNIPVADELVWSSTDVETLGRK